ncbi:MAG: hypothetical protein NTV72_01555 [Candidatus Taylorbacteria bacterium]|nr:hypothetical protein [Candidatus Taylorbacteria bacterium]
MNDTYSTLEAILVSSCALLFVWITINITMWLRSYGDEWTKTTHFWNDMGTARSFTTSIVILFPVGIMAFMAKDMPTGKIMFLAFVILSLLISISALRKRVVSEVKSLKSFMVNMLATLNIAYVVAVTLYLIFYHGFFAVLLTGFDILAGRGWIGPTL